MGGFWHMLSSPRDRIRLVPIQRWMAMLFLVVLRQARRVLNCGRGALLLERLFRSAQARSSIAHPHGAALPEGADTVVLQEDVRDRGRPALGCRPAQSWGQCARGWRRHEARREIFQQVISSGQKILA
jgi:hypothetical protein